MVGLLQGRNCIIESCGTEILLTLWQPRSRETREKPGINNLNKNFQVTPRDPFPLMKNSSLPSYICSTVTKYNMEMNEWGCWPVKFMIIICPVCESVDHSQVFETYYCFFLKCLLPFSCPNWFSLLFSTELTWSQENFLIFPLYMDYFNSLFVCFQNILSIFTTTVFSNYFSCILVMIFLIICLKITSMGPRIVLDIFIDEPQNTKHCI